LARRVSYGKKYLLLERSLTRNEIIYVINSIVFFIFILITIFQCQTCGVLARGLRDTYGDGWWNSLLWRRTRLWSVVMCFYNSLLQDNITYKWIWKHDSRKDYLVKEVYNILSKNDQHDRAKYMELIWNKALTLKVFPLAWIYYDKRQFVGLHDMDEFVRSQLILAVST